MPPRIDDADLEQPLDLPTASIEVVVASLVLHYLADWTPLLSELHRILVPDGALVFSIHHPITGTVPEPTFDCRAGAKGGAPMAQDCAPFAAASYRHGPAPLLLGVEK